MVASPLTLAVPRPTTDNHHHCHRPISLPVSFLMHTLMLAPVLGSKKSRPSSQGHLLESWGTAHSSAPLRPHHHPWAPHPRWLCPHLAPLARWGGGGEYRAPHQPQHPARPTARGRGHEGRAQSSRAKGHTRPSPALGARLSRQHPSHPPPPRIVQGRSLIAPCPRLSKRAAGMGEPAGAQRLLRWGC